ncbi:beta-propeller fold lactonase family protein [Anaerobacillus sp. CMMVII]|nr:beta-propeller fold lactonase family protein [Anaerobacillus sp. CMMVII]
MRWFTTIAVLALILLLAACGEETETGSIQEEKVEGATEVETEPTIEVGVEVEESYVVVVANEKDETLSLIYYPEQRQEIIELDGQAHNVEINVETELVWVTINPPHDDKDGHGHGHGHDDNLEKVVAYDLNTLQKVEEYEVGNHPAHVSTTQDGNIVVVSNSGDNTVTIINRESAELATVPVGEYPHGLRISVDQKFVFIANMKSADMSIVDLETKEEVNRVVVGNGAVQTGISHDGQYAFVGLHLDNQLAVVDVATQELMKLIDTGVGPVQMYASYDNRYVIVANQGSEDAPSDTITIVSLETLEVVKEIQLGKGAHGIVISKDSRYAFVTNMFEDTVSVVDLETLEETTRIEVGYYPNGISIN